MFPLENELPSNAAVIAGIPHLWETDYVAGVGSPAKLSSKTDVNFLHPVMKIVCKVVYSVLECDSGIPFSAAERWHNRHLPHRWISPQWIL